MDTEFDESMDAFKKPTANEEKKKKLVLVKKANIKKRGNIGKKLKDSPKKIFPKKFKNKTSEKGSTTSTSRDNMSSCCPTCGERFDFSALKAHTRICLRANFEAYRPTSKNREEDNVIPGESYFCPTCGTDLSLFTKAQRNTHANRCLDHSMTEKDSKNISGSSPKKAPSTVDKDKLRCLICAKVLASHSGLKRHYVSCQKRNKFSTMTALALNRPQDDEDDNVELLAEIRRSKNRLNAVDNVSSKNTSKTKVRKTRKPKTKSNVKKYDDEMLALTIAISKDEDVTKKMRKPRKKGKYALEEPVMLSMSPSSKLRELQQRREEISRPAENIEEESIPSTPALPVSSLNLPTRRANIRILSSRSNCDEAGPSNRGIADENQAQMSNTDDTLVSNKSPLPITPPEQGDSLVPIPESESRQHPKMSHSEELQSPEVSSSSLISAPVSTSDYNSGVSDENLELPMQEQESQSSSTKTDSRPSRWTMTTSNGSDSGQSAFRVRGLLTQFEPKKATVPNRQESSSSNRNIEETTEISEVKVEETNNGEIDCTLLALDALETPSQDPTQDSSSFHPVDIPDDSNDRNELLSSSQYKKIVDNPKFSDAKILAGESQDIIHLHKNILLCRCPELLDKLDGSDRLILKDIEKSDILPLIHYIYSGSLNFMLSEAKKSENFRSKIVHLMELFCVTLSDTEQMIFDALSENKTILDQVEGSGSFLKTLTEPLEMGKNEGVPDEIGFFEEDLKPQNLTQEDPATIEEPLIDNDPDVFSKSDVDMFDLNSSSCASKIVEEELFDEITNQKHCEIVTEVCDLPNFDRGESTPEEDFFSDSNDSFINLSQTASVTSEKSESQSVNLEKSGSCVSSKKRKRKRAFDSPAPRMSKRRSSGQHRKHSKYGTCPCCQEEPILTKPKFKEKSKMKFPAKAASNSLKKKSFSKSKTPTKISQNSTTKMTASPMRIKVDNNPISPKVGRTPQKRKYSQSKQNITKSMQVTKASGCLLSSGSKDFPSKKFSSKSPRSNENRTLPMSPKNLSQSKESFAKSPRATKSTYRSIPTKSETSSDTPKRSKMKEIQEIRRRSLSICRRRSSRQRSSLSGDTIYVSERLPRFKQREHIRSRPGVANMAKSINKTPKPKKTHEKVPISEANDTNIERKIISLSQPVESESPQLNVMATDVIIDHTEEMVSVVKPKLKKYKFKRLHLAGYASPNPNTSQSTPKQNQQEKKEKERLSSESDISGYDSECEIAANLFFDDSFEMGCLNTPTTSKSFTENLETFENFTTPQKPSYSPPDHNENFATPQTNTNSTQGIDSKYKSYSPVPITPMPDYTNMPTPDVIKQAAKFGLKKTLGKGKLRTKLQEAYLYKHLLPPTNESDSSDTSTDMEDKEFVPGSPYEDDLQNDPVKIQRRLTLELSRLSASPGFHSDSFEIVYTFASYTPSEIEKLATKVVDKMHEDGTLLKALQDTKNETGSIKRGSRQDHNRCWNIVTPGSSGYDPKINAILRFSEEYHSAITGPLVSCVVKNYITYKKSQFDCLPVICDRMQNELNHEKF